MATLPKREEAEYCQKQDFPIENFEYIGIKLSLLVAQISLTKFFYQQF